MIIMFARYASVIPLSEVINFVNSRIYRRGNVIPRNHQLMIWWAGLRGAISFALSYDVVGPSGPAIRTTTLCVCVVSIIVLGSTTDKALIKWNIKTGFDVDVNSLSNRATRIGEDVDTDVSDSSSEEVEDWDDQLPGSSRKPAQFVRPFQQNDNDDTESIASSTDQLSPTFRSSRRTGTDTTHWFISFDNKYLKPIFTRKRLLRVRLPTPNQSPFDARFLSTQR